MKKYICYLLLSLTIALPTQAAKYAGEVFSLGAGARALALGSAVVAGPFDATSGYWNPAGLALWQKRSITAMHAETFGSLLNHDFVSYVDARPKGDNLIKAFGVYLYYLGGGGIKLTSLDLNNRPYVINEVTHGDYLLAGSIAGSFNEKLNFGLTAKLIYRDLGTEKGKGLALDAGLHYQYRKNISLGLMISDISSGVIRYSGATFDNDANYESIYPTLKPGIMISRKFNDFSASYLMSSDIKFENIETAAQYWIGAISLDSHFGLELAYKEILFGRTGFDIGRFTAGGGVSVKNISIDFAYLHHSELDETFRISAGYNW